MDVASAVGKDKVFKSILHTAKSSAEIRFALLDVTGAPKESTQDTSASQIETKYDWSRTQSEIKENTIQINTSMCKFAETGRPSIPVLKFDGEHEQVNYIEIMFSVCGQRVEPNVMNARGNTALDLVAKYGSRADVVRELLDRGVDVNAVNMLGRTALHEAVEADAVEVVRVLLEGGAKWSLRDFGGVSPVRLAVNLRRAKVVWALSEGGASFGEINDTGGRWFLRSVFFGHLGYNEFRLATGKEVEYE
jgi:hypothetical protein